MKEWLEQAETTMTELLPKGQPVLVAVSGGIDSMVLLHALHELAPTHKWQLVVAHFNHQLRGAASDADEQLVRKTAKSLDVPIIVGSGDVRSVAASGKLSLEMAARQLRHEFLAQSARAHQSRVIALAHHAGDQVELFFLRLFRGTGSIGLGGMKPVSALPADPAIQLVRPFLDFSKETLRAFAIGRQIAFSEDATNADLDIQRNRIRHELLPLLEAQYQPGLSRTIPRLMEITAAEGDFITNAAQSWIEGRTPAFEQLPLPVQRRSLQLQLYALKEDAGFELVEWLRLNPGRKIRLGSQAFALREPLGTVCLFPGEETPPALPNVSQCQAITLGSAGAAEFAGLKVSWVLSDKSGCEFVPIRGEYFDADRVGVHIHLRFWRPGDRFQLIGARSPSKLQDLFTNLKVPRAERHQRVVAVTAEGEIFWVEGLRISERFRLDKSTIRRLKWEWCR